MTEKDKKELESLIDKKIAEHELRVALFSGIPGVLLLIAYAHAIHINNSLINYVRDFIGMN